MAEETPSDIIAKAMRPIVEVELQKRDDPFTKATKTLGYPLRALQGIADALAQVERVLSFDLRRMITFGPDYNQAVRDALDTVIATRRWMTEELESVDRSEVLPDCMMPDGGEACQGYLNQFGENMNMRRRLRRIEAIIECVDNRCLAADGPVTPTLQEITQAELSQIYALARGRDD